MKSRCVGCGKSIKFKAPIYRLTGHPSDDYCSRSCIENAWSALHPKAEEPVDRIAEDFGDAGVVRHFCDRCQSPITLAWKGRYGTYCSNPCLKIAERSEGEQMSDIEDTDATAAIPASPITAGAPAKKKAPAKAAPAPKSAPAQTAKPPATKAAVKPVTKPVAKASTKSAAKPVTKPTTKAPTKKLEVKTKSYPNDAVIKVIKEAHTRRGRCGEGIDFLLKCKGKTVAEFRKGLKEKDENHSVDLVLRTGLTDGLIAFK